MSAATDRRELMATLAGLGLASLAGVAGLAAPASAGQQAAAVKDAPPVDVLGRLPWPYQALDADAVAQRAFAANSRGGCMFAAFDPIARAVAERLGAPYTAFPFALFTYGAGGVAGWGTLCGALNGAAAAFALLSPQPGPLITALYSWYEREAIPDFVPTGVRFPNVPAVTGSVLCHASVARWCKASGKKSSSPERAERCGVLSASVARKAVTLLNAQVTGSLTAPSLDAAVGACLGCHGGRGPQANTSGRMTCAPCHTPAELEAKGHPKS